MRIKYLGFDNPHKEKLYDITNKKIKQFELNLKLFECFSSFSNIK